MYLKLKLDTMDCKSTTTRRSPGLSNTKCLKGTSSFVSQETNSAQSHLFSEAFLVKMKFI